MTVQPNRHGVRVPAWARRDFLKTLAATACAAAAPAWAGAAEESRPKPNIVLIYTDDLDFDDIGGSLYPVDRFPSVTGAYLNGLLPRHEPESGRVAPFYESAKMHMPALEGLAKQGAVFDRFYITSPMCTPSRYSLMTGRYASRSASMVEETPGNEPSWVAWNAYFRRDDPSLGRELKRLGYFTAFIGKTHNGEPEEWHPRWIHKQYGADPKLLLEKLQEAQAKVCGYLCDTLGFDLADRICVGNADKVGGHNLPWYTEGALDFLDKHHPSPFFLYLALPVPHAPALWPHYDVDTTMTPVGKREQAPACQPSLDDVRRRLRENGASPRSVGVTWIDDALAAILAKLDALGIAENTLVIFTSDHQSRGKNSVYEGARVPCVMRWPATIRPGTRVKDICANIDFLPTLVDVAGGAPLEQGDGISFRQSLIQGEPQHPDRALLIEAGYSRAVVKGDWKYIAARPPDFDRVLEDMRRDAERAEREGRLPRIGWKGGDKPDSWFMRTRAEFPWAGSPDQLYRLDNDVFEQYNVIVEKAYEKRLDDLRSELRRLLADLPRPFQLDAKLRGD